LPRCIETLQRTTYSPYEIVVVDNNSSDGSLEYLQTNHPEVILYPIKQNLGYSGAYNAVIPKVSGDILVLLNFDVEVEPEWLDQAVQIMESDPGIAAVQPKLKSLQNRHLLEYAGGSGGFIDRYGYPFVRGRIFNQLEEDTGQYDDVIPIHWASGAALITRKSAYEAVGGLDSDFFLHMEEIDLCWRYWLNGWKVKTAPQGIVYHYSGAALAPDKYYKMYYNQRNSLVMLLKNFSLSSLIKYLPVRLFLDWMTILSSPLLKQSKRSGAVVAAHAYVCFHLFSIWKKRAAVQKLRKIADRDLAHIIHPRSIVLQYYLKKQRTFSKIMVCR
jgi:GT2 family glycosyltransferase